MENKIPIITFPRWGNYTIAFKGLFNDLGVQVIPPDKTNPKTIEEGSKMAPEMFCFPLKVTLGNYLPALRKGANTVFMVQNVGGSCRQRYYGKIQEKALLENGWCIDFIDFKATPKDIYKKIQKVSKASFLKILVAGVNFFRRLHLIEKIEKVAQFYRPREINKGSTDMVLLDSFSKIDDNENLESLTKIKNNVLKKFLEIKIDKNKKVPKVALIGEIYTVCDPSINYEIERKLGREDIEVYRQMDVTYHLKKLIFPWKDWLIQKKISPYLKSTVGGHGRDAVYEMLHYVEKDFDGIVHLLPFGCMPEVTIRPILEKIHRQSGIPFLSLSLDEQVAEAGINTRLEAFVDVVKNHYKNKKIRISCRY